jgi:hypothetical protein
MTCTRSPDFVAWHAAAPAGRGLPVSSMDVVTSSHKAKGATLPDAPLLNAVASIF